MTPSERFWLKVSKTESCWLWTAGLFKDGYGQFWDGLKQVRAHRFAYEETYGPIPDELVVDHTCHNDSKCGGGNECLHRRCVNPYHLNATTRSENILLSKWNRRSDVCKMGHNLDRYGTRYKSDRGGVRCKLCRIDQSMESLVRQKERLVNG